MDFCSPRPRVIFSALVKRAAMAVASVKSSKLGCGGLRRLPRGVPVTVTHFTRVAYKRVCDTVSIDNIPGDRPRPVYSHFWGTKMPETPYVQRYKKGSYVRIVDRSALEDFQRSWTLHNKLRLEQLNYGNRVAEVARVGYYHGGDVLYELVGIPSCWHECCLQEASPPPPTLTSDT